MFFIDINKFYKGFYKTQLGWGSMNALSQVDTKGHLKHIFFSTILNAARTAFALVTISLEVYSALLTGQGFLRRFFTSYRGSLWKIFSSICSSGTFFYLRRVWRAQTFSFYILSAPILVRILWKATLQSFCISVQLSDIITRNPIEQVNQLKIQKRFEKSINSKSKCNQIFNYDNWLDLVKLSKLQSQNKQQLVYNTQFIPKTHQPFNYCIFQTTNDMLLRRTFNQASWKAALNKNFSQAKKKVFKYSEDQYQKSEQLMQFQLPQHRFRSKYSFLNNQTLPQNVTDINLQNLNLRYLKDTEQFSRIPKLAHGLNKFLKGQLVQHDNGLGDIPQNVSDEVFDQMSQYRSPKNDKELINLSKQNGCKYFSSTSNISTALIQIYYMFSMFRRPNFENIFEGCPDQPRIHMVSFRKPITYVLSEVEPNLYSIESDKGFLVPSNYVLTKLGTLGEYFLTHEKQEIKRLEQQLIVAEQKNYYRYTVANNNLFLRSQIDCRDNDETGKPFVFEIKTRACAPIRYDVQRYQDYMDYPIDKKQGKFESFERQYYDLIRGGFIKYAFQLKIGRMDGAFIAYHNTKKIYGFEYVRLKEIIMRLFGDEFNFDSTFLIISKLMTDINDYIINDLKNQYDTSQLKIGMYANACNRSLIVMVEVMDKIKEYKPIKLPGQNAFYDVVNNMELNPNIFRYEFNFYTFLNGVLYRQPDVYFEPNDQIQIKMSVQKQGKLHKIQYMSFLQEAYKIDSFFGNFRYNGMWGKF